MVERALVDGTLGGRHPVEELDTDGMLDGILLIVVDGIPRLMLADGIFRIGIDPRLGGETKKLRACLERGKLGADGRRK